VVRRVVQGELGPSGGPALTDVIGTLEAWDDDTLAVRRADGDVVTIALADVVAGKPVPPRPAR
jgi:N-acetylglutamate synthase